MGKNQQIKAGVIKLETTAKFELSQLIGIGLTLVILGIAISYGIDIMGDTHSDMCSDSSQYFDTNSQSCYSCVTPNTHYLPSNHSCGPNATSHNFSATVNQSAEFNATGNAISGVSKLPEKLPTIVTVIVAAVIIGILVRYLWIKSSG